MFSCLLLTAIMVMSSAQPTPNPYCDPQTEYADGNNCCKLCEPGKRMSPSSCQHPVCVDCEPNRYQDEHNKEAKCKQQPYCDPNKNFQVLMHVSNTEKNSCVCKKDFHCSSTQCITCVPHTTCEPGEDLFSKGNQTHDSVCRPCPEGTFSSTTNSKCVQWTKCKEGFHVAQNGTSRSDRVCEANSRAHIIAGVVIFVLIVFILAIVFLVYKYLDKSRYKGEKLFENGHVEVIGPKIMIQEEMSEFSQPIISVPVEDEDVDMSSEHHPKTENGHCLVQEDGKPDRLSRQESQGQASSASYSSY
ncbi:tumor necrosis factor receptor superfamily member 5 [Kryptolebias marmoratus]|uniref:CD40 molecule, TNF receptor superfamily member 5 n=1 Tax=Kryptolebias marmoratus TaxID=37003 RepID=A0A3Q2ZL07_KRYMA|nr:tumor necrosis factor receptor superfamily member 5 [Kryptolebias marmoratus]